MEKKLIKKIISSSVSLLAALLLFLMVAIVSYSWISANKRVDTQGSKVRIVSMNGIRIESYQVYKRDGATDSAILLIDTADPSFVKDADELYFEMTEFDTVFVDKNVNTPIVIRVVLCDILLDGSKVIPMDVTVSCIKNHFRNNNKMTEYMSNIISINFGAIQSLDALDKYSDANAIYNGVTETFADDPERYVAKTFVYEDSTVWKKDEQITFTLTEYDINNGKAIVYLELTYSSANVSQYIEENGFEISLDDIGEGSVAGEDIIAFPFDIGEIAFNYHYEEED